jgi:serine/threonine protein kinase
MQIENSISKTLFSLSAPLASLVGLGLLANLALNQQERKQSRSQVRTRMFLNKKRRLITATLDLAEINQELGAGTTGLVVSAKATDGLTCALKIIDRSNAAVDLEYLQDEIETLRAVQSCPNIIDFVGSHNIGNYTIVTTLQFGTETIYTRLKEHGAFNERTALRFFLQLHRALAFLEDNEFLHRDVKPKNILVQNGSLQLCDFGVACKLKDGKAVGQVGTLAFAAPEVWLGSPYGPSVDWYSAGVVLYHMLCDTAPFEVSMNDQRHSCSSPPRRKQQRYGKSRLGNEADYPAHLSKGAKEILESLMSHNPNTRSTAAAVNKLRWMNSTH